MAVEQYSLMVGDWLGLGHIINDLATRIIGQIVAPGSSPDFAGATLSGLTASRLVQTDASKDLASVTDLTSWIAGTENQISVAGANGAVTLAIINPLKLSYDGSNYITLTVESDGDLTVDSNKASYNLDLGDGNVSTSGTLTANTLTDGTATITGGLGTFGGITIFNPTPILVFKDSTYAGDTSLGFMEWRDKNNTRLGYFGNSSSGNDDLSWKNESSGGHIKIETTGAGEFQIFANTVLDGTANITGTVTGASGSTFGTLTLADGSITDSGGTIAFGNEDLQTIGHMGLGFAGANSLYGLYVAYASATTRFGVFGDLSYTGTSSTVSAQKFQMKYSGTSASPDVQGIWGIGSLYANPSGTAIVDGVKGSIFVSSPAKTQGTHEYSALKGHFYDTSVGRYSGTAAVTLYGLYLPTEPDNYDGGASYDFWSIYSPEGDSYHFDDLAFGQTDKAERIGSDADGYLDLYAGTEVRVHNFIRHSSASYRRYYHLSVGGFDPGASGATWIDPTANHTGGWRLNAEAEVLIAGTDIHADWDGVSDITVEIRFALNAAGVGDNIVDLNLVAYYNGIGDTATKTQTVEVPTATDGTQYKVYKAIFTLDYDAVDNVIDAGDEITFILNLLNTSDPFDVIITGGAFFYNTTHIGIESGDT